MWDILFAQAAGAVEVAQAGGFWGGAGVGGTVAGGGLTALMLWYINLRDGRDARASEKHNETMVTMNAAHLENTKQAREDSQQLVAKLLAQGERSVKAMTEQNARIDALIDRFDMYLSRQERGHEGTDS